MEWYKEGAQDWDKIYDKVKSLEDSLQQRMEQTRLDTEELYNLKKAIEKAEFSQGDKELKGMLEFYKPD